ncbi:hypothetical protein [Aureimonas jatrophae]|uniref:Uncharacterized protein n=1 Tax=Aureimonas jatrophae TaxID=1166073 RepID=A0A1H0K633_9HYPH|nr:hypothetical protein [Aureimonas jatrophae]MBB3950972.1 hypothetical protein [Aureimonas jatrophae]SDO51528.1 hypothetical protein SAMN05192530_107119 [Aureimonas jatrophae]
MDETRHDGEGLTLLAVLRSGGRYDASWMERLARGARAHIRGLGRIRCLTDLDMAVEGVETVVLRHDWPRWWAKFEAFRPGLTTGTTLLCDLDTVFAGDASALAEPGLAAMEDHFLKGRVSSALLRWQGDELAFLYERFAADPMRWMEPGSCGPVPNSVHGDQVVIDHWLRERGLVPDFLQTRYPRLLDFYDPAKSDPGPVVIFIGDSKPDNAVGPVARLWAGEAVAA